MGKFRYDVIKAKFLMDEVDEYLNSLWKDINKDEDKKIVRSCTCREQTELFDSIYKTINNYQLAKLTYEKHVNEPVLRRLALDKATKRVHKAFSYVFWNSKHIAWLHGVLLDGLGSSLFLCYLEILQSLKRKEPELIERTLLEDKTATEKERSAGLPNLSAKLKKNWDPSVGLSTKLNIEKFPSTPFLLMIPSGPNIPQQSSKRSRFWNNQLVNFAKPISINIPAYKTPEGYVVKHYLEHCISAIRTKISGCRHCFPERLIVLVGWGVGSLIALKVALLDKVDAVICLGFPGKQVHNKESEEYWDSYSKVECPVLFFVGAHGTLSSITETEKLRNSIKSETGLVIVESGDDMLRLSKGLKMKLGLTQNMIDKLIQDEIYLFIKKLSVLSLKSHHIKEQFNPKKKKRKIETVSKEEIKIIRKRIFQKNNTLQPLKLAQTPSSKPPIDLTSSSNNKQNLSAGLLTTANLYLTSTTSEETTKPAFTMSDQPIQSSPNQFSSTKIQKKKYLKEKNRKVRNAYKTSFDLQPPGEKKHCSSSSYLVADVCNTTPNVHQGQAGLLASSCAGQIQVQGGSFYYLPQTHASLCSKNVHLSSASSFPNLKSQLVSSCSGKQTIVVHPTSRFVINQPISNISTLSSSSAQLAESENNAENIKTQLNLNNTSSGNIKKHLSTNTASDCETQTSLLTSPQSLPSIPTTSFVTDLSPNDLRYLASLILKQTTQSSSSNNSSIFISTTTKFSAFASASANTSSSMYVGVKYLPSSSLSKSQFTPKPIVSSNVSTCIVSTNEKPSVFTNVQDNSSHTMSVSQCNSKIRPTGVLRKSRVKTPYLFTGVCGNGASGNFTLTYNTPYQSTKPTGFLNSAKISSPPTSSSVTSAYFSQPKSENSVLIHATKSIVSSTNLNFSNISEAISSTSKPITHPISSHFTGCALQDNKEKKQFTNTILKNIFEHKLLEAKSDHLSEKQAVLDKQYLSEKPVKVEDEQRTVDEQKRMYSVLQNFLKQTSQSCAEITRTDKLKILNVAAAKGTRQNVAAAKGTNQNVASHNSAKTNFQFDELTSLQSAHSALEESNQKMAIDQSKDDVENTQFYSNASLNCSYSMHPTLQMNGLTTSNLNQSINSNNLSKTQPTLVLNKSPVIDLNVNTEVIDDSVKSSIFASETCPNKTNQMSQPIRDYDTKNGLCNFHPEKSIHLTAENSTNLNPAPQSKNEILCPPPAITNNEDIKNEAKEELSNALNPETVSSENGCNFKTGVTKKKMKCNAGSSPELKVVLETSCVTQGGRVLRNRYPTDSMSISISPKFKSDESFNKPEEALLNPLGFPSNGDDAFQHVRNERLLPINGYLSQSADISSEQIFHGTLRDKPVDILLKAENCVTNGSIKELRLSTESQPFFMTDSIANLKSTLHSMNNLKEKGLLFTEPKMSYLIKSDSFENTDCSKKDIF